jgi:hypothetical protein
MPAATTLIAALVHAIAAQVDTAKKLDIEIIWGDDIGQSKALSGILCQGWFR